MTRHHTPLLAALALLLASCSAAMGDEASTAEWDTGLGDDASTPADTSVSTDSGAETDTEIMDDVGIDVPDDGDGSASIPTWTYEFVHWIDGDFYITGPRERLCDATFCDSEFIEPDSWQVLYVDPDSDATGEPDGTIDAPLKSLADALTLAADQPTTLYLAAGAYQGPIEPQAGLQIIGVGAAETRITGDNALPLINAVGVDGLILRGVHLDGGQRALNIKRTPFLLVENTILSGGGLGGALLQRVDSAAFLGTYVDALGGQLIETHESNVAVTSSWLAGGGEGGVLASPSEPVLDCGASTSPSCPYSNRVWLDASYVEGFDGAGVTLDMAQSLITRSRIDGGDLGAHALDATHAFVSVADRTVLERTADVGALLRSSRATLEDMQILACEGGGATLERVGASEAAIPQVDWYPGVGWTPVDDWYPGVGWLPAPDPAIESLEVDWYPGVGWRPREYPGVGWRPSDAYPGVGWRPRPDWYPGVGWFPNPALLPEGLNPDSESLAPDVALHLWAYSDLSDVTIADTAGVGLAVSGHPVGIDNVAITDTLGDPGVGFMMTQRADSHVFGSESSLVALSQIGGLTAVRSATFGVLIDGVALQHDDTGDDSGADRFVGLELEDITARTNGLGGIALRESTVALTRATLDDNSGVGLWSVGASLQLRESEVAGTKPVLLPGRDGDDVEVADGVIIEGTPLWGAAEGLVQIATTTIATSSRVGLFIINDETPVHATVDVVFNDNGTDFAATNATDADLFVTEGGVDAEADDGSTFGVPGLPQ